MNITTVLSLNVSDDQMAYLGYRQKAYIEYSVCFNNYTIKHLNFTMYGDNYRTQQELEEYLLSIHNNAINVTITNVSVVKLTQQMDYWEFFRYKLRSLN